MEIIDVHVHVTGKLSRAMVEEFFAKAEVTGAVLISRKPQAPRADARRCIEELAEVSAALGGRVYPFARLDPTTADAPAILEWAVKSCGFRGLKMLPSNFHPADACARVMYETAGRLGVPLLMHTGILWNPGNSADNCRPGNMEVMWDYPSVRFALAHIGWPWTDECIAVAQKMRVLRAERDQAFVDLTPGTPAIYRRDALFKCLDCVGADYMMYGSDSVLPSSGQAEYRWKQDRDILNTLGVPEVEQRKIFSGAALRFLSAGAPAPAATGRPIRVHRRRRT